MSDLIEGVAKIRQNQFFSGAELAKEVEPKYFQETRKKSINGVEVEASARSYVSPLAYKYIINVSGHPVYYEQIKNLDPELRMTKGFYMIKYTPKGSGEYRKGRPFKIGQDLIRMSIRVAGPKHWNCLCDRIPELNWIREYSTFTDDLFGTALRHPGMTLWFSVDWPRYEKHLQSQSETVLKSPLVSRKVSAKDYNEIYKKNDKTIMIRYLHDVLKDIQSTEISPAVQEEMIASTGETGITNEQYLDGNRVERDPETGRFIKKNQNQTED